MKILPAGPPANVTVMDNQLRFDPPEYSGGGRIREYHVRSYDITNY